MTLHLYFARRFLVAFVLILAAFAAILMLLDMVELVRRYAGMDLGRTAWLAALDVPQGLYRILPLVMILAAIALFLTLARTSELVVARAAGRSALRSLAGPVAASLLVGLIAIGVLNPIVAGTIKARDTAERQLALGTTNVMSVSREGVWLRQGGAQGQTVIHAARANLDGTRLDDVSFTTFAPGGGPTRRIDAAQAVLVTGAWELTAAKIWSFAPGTNPEREARTAAAYVLASDLTAAQIRDSFGPPEAIPLWDLPAFIADLDRAGFSAIKHRVWFQTELALPLLLAAMVLVGAGFTMRQVRSGRTGTMVLLALLAGFGIFFLRNFAQVLGETGQLPVILAAWAAPAAAVLFALGLLLNLEDG